MKLGNIPALTWNRLSMNHAEYDPDRFDFKEADLSACSLPPEVTVKRLSPDKAKEWLNENAPAQLAENLVAAKQPIYHPQTFSTGLGGEYDAFIGGAVNSVALIDIPEGLKAEAPLYLTPGTASGERNASSVIIHAGANSSAEVIMKRKQEANGSGAFASMVRCVLDEGSSLTLAEANLLGKDAVYLEDLGASLSENASMKLIRIELGGSTVISGSSAELVGNASSFDAKTGYIALKDQSADMNYVVVHRGENTHSEMLFNGVLDDNSGKRLSDTIDFRRGAKGSFGHESENVLLLSDNAENKSLPVILCEEEDMEGSHGASIGRLDDAMLFYMATRGIDEAEAEKLMVRSRLRAVAREIPDKDLKKEIDDFIGEAFA